MDKNFNRYLEGFRRLFSKVVEKSDFKWKARTRAGLLSPSEKHST
nr:MAG TPA: hypothetical protein [Bacteriophage sp.]